VLIDKAIEIAMVCNRMVC